MRSPARLDDALGFGSRSPDAKLKAYQAAAGRADQLEKGHQGEWCTFLESVLERISLQPDAIDVDLCPTGFAAEISSPTPTATCVWEQLGQDAPGHRVRINTRLKRCGGEMRLVLLGDDKELDAPYPDPGLIKAVAKAQVWTRQLIAGEATSIAEIAKREGTSRPHASRLLNLAFLAPDIVDAILDGRQPPDVNVEVLTKTLRLPLASQDQRRVLGFS